MNRSPILILTVLIVGAFLVLATAVSTPAETPQDFEKRVMPQVVEDAPEPPRLTDAQLALQEELKGIGEGFEGAAGISVTKASDLATISYQGETPFPQQSVSKLWVTMAALNDVDKGRLDLDERVEIRAPDLTVFYQPIRNTVLRTGRFVSDFEELIDRAITQSDNTANDRILRRIGGPEAVQDFLDTHGLSSIRFGTDERTKQSAIAGLEWRQSYSVGPAFFEARDKLPQAVRREAFEAYLADPVDGAPPVAIAEAFARLLGGDILKETSTALLLETLERTKSGPRRLKAGAPAGWIVRHKTGTGQFFDGEQSGYNDVGIITSPEGRSYAVAVMIARTRAPTPERMEMMQEVVRAVVAYDAAVASRSPGA